MTNDAELMIAFRDGSGDAFEKLVLRHQVGLFNFFTRLVGNQQMAEDLTQEVFFKVYSHASSYVQTAKFTTYLYRIAKNSWIDYVRKNARRGTMQSLDKEFEGGQSAYDFIEGREEKPETRLEHEEMGQAITGALEELPDEQRIVFVLSEVQGMKYAEISETLEIPLGTVKSRMHVAVHRLREILTRRGVVA